MIRERPARRSDAARIHELIDTYAREGRMLARTEAEIRSHLGRFFVLEEGEQVMACAALEPYPDGEAELRSLAVDPARVGRGYGKRLIQHVLSAAQEKGLFRVFVVSHSPELFVRQGFFAIARQELGQKVARDCRGCPKAANCELGAAVFFLPVRARSISGQLSVQTA